MNLCLLLPNDYQSPALVKLSGRRALHIAQIIKANVGESIKVGNINGLIGEAKLLSIKGSKHAPEVELGIENDLTQEPPKQLPLTLILALPRPKMLQRSLQTIATLGVKKLCLTHTQRVEKSFWQTPSLAQKKIEEHFILGLEQARATQMPELVCYKKFSDCLENELSNIDAQYRKIIAHPGDFPMPRSEPEQDTVLAIGPEGGFVDGEVSRFLEQGFEPVQLGERILRVETAVPVTIAKLF